MSIKVRVSYVGRVSPTPKGRYVVTKAGWLKGLALLMGYACVAIGLFHVVLGIASVPGEESAGATVDSRERFYNAIFLGYGLAWLWVARQSPIPAKPVHVLTAVFLLGGVGRLLSIAVHGLPHWWQLPLTALELFLPPVYFWLASADERAAAARTRSTDQVTNPAPQQGR